MTQTVGVVGGINPVVSRDRVQSPITTYNYIGGRELFFLVDMLFLYIIFIFSPLSI